MTFIRGDRVFIRDAEPTTLATAARERLAMVTDAGSEGKGRGELRVAIPDPYDEAAEAVQTVSADLLEPAGTLGERYEQVVGPFMDFVTMWTKAVKLVQRGDNPRRVDVIGIHWPEWFLIVEIRPGRVEVPLARDHPEWRWHMAVLPR